MINNPVLNTATKQKLDVVQYMPPQALLLTGSAGVGKRAVAEWLASNIVGTTSIREFPYFLELQSAEPGKAIGIESIRTLEHFISLRVTSDKAINRLILIADAHTLTHEAQNALLKTLEEPPVGTMLLLTSTSADALLPTIRSRLQTIEITPPLTADLANALRSESLDDKKLQQIVALSGGLPGLAFALAAGDDTHPLVQAANSARELLQQSTFERLCKVEALSKKKEQAQNLIAMLMHMSRAALLTGRSSDRWKQIMKAAYAADESLSKGVQTKLVLTNLMLSI